MTCLLSILKLKTTAEKTQMLHYVQEKKKLINSDL